MSHITTFCKLVLHQMLCKSTSSSCKNLFFSTLELSILNFSDETERYRIPKRAQATTSVVVIDPLQQVVEPAALARSQTFDLVQEV